MRNGKAVQVSSYEREAPELQDVPQYLRETMRPQLQQSRDFMKAVRALPNATEKEAEAYRQIYVLEGGVNTAGNGASSGLTPQTLSNARMKWGITGLSADVMPKDLNAEQRAQIYRAYMDDIWKDAGGSAQAFQAIDDSGIATFAADTSFREGSSKGNRMRP